MAIAVPVATGSDAGVVRRLPFTIGVISDLSNGQHQRRFRNRRFNEVRASTFDEFFKRRSPALEISISAMPATGVEEISLQFNHIVDFEPETIARQVPQTTQFLQYKQSFIALLRQVESDYNFEDVIKEFMLQPSCRDEFRREGPAALKNLPCWT